MRTTRAAGAAAAFLIGLSLAACSGGDEAAPVEEEATTVEEPTETAEEEPTPEEPTETAEEETTAEEPTETIDRTAELLEAGGEQVWVDSITSATETEPGRIEIQTTIVDPRTDASEEAASAVAACEAAVETLGAAHVSVLEEDGTSFVLYGHPQYGEECVEV